MSKCFPERTNKKVSKSELKQITERAKPKEEEQSDGISSGNTAQYSRETVSTWYVHSPSEFNQQTKLNEIIQKTNRQSKQAKIKLKNKTALMTQTKGISQLKNSRVIGQEKSEQKKEKQTIRQKEQILNQGSSCSRLRQCKVNLTTPRRNDLSYQQNYTSFQSEKRNDCKENIQRSKENIQRSKENMKIDQMAKDDYASDDMSSDKGNCNVNSSSDDVSLSNSDDIDWKRENMFNKRTIPKETSENEEEEEEDDDEEEEVKVTQNKHKIRSFSSNTKSELLSKMQELEGELKRETTRRRRLEKQVIQSTSDLTQLMCQLSIFQQNVKQTKIFALQAAAKANNNNKKSFSSSKLHKPQELQLEYNSCQQQHHHQHSQSQIIIPALDRTHSFQETPSKQSSAASCKFKQKNQGNSSRKTNQISNNNNSVISFISQKHNDQNRHANHSQEVIHSSNSHLKETNKARIIQNNTEYCNNQKIKQDKSTSENQSQKNNLLETIMRSTFQQNLEQESIMEDTGTVLSQLQISSAAKQIQDTDNSLCLSLSKLSVMSNLQQSSGHKTIQQAVQQPLGQEIFQDINLSQNNIFHELKQIQQIDQSSSNNSNNNNKNQIYNPNCNLDNNSIALNQNKFSMIQHNNDFLKSQQSQINLNNKSIADETFFLKQETQPILSSNYQSQQQLTKEQQQQRQLHNQLFLLSLQNQTQPQLQQAQQPLQKTATPQSNFESQKQQQPLFYRTACKTNIQLNSSAQDFLSLADLSCNFKNKPTKSEQIKDLQSQTQQSVNQDFGLASGASIFSLGSDTLSYSASRKTTPNKQSSSQLFYTPSKSPALFICPSSKGLKLNNSTSSFNICSSQHGGAHSSQFQTPQKKMK